MKLALARKMEAGGDMVRIEMLEGEVEAAKESEMKMLESLVSQTKQLEQAKIELEEAKLEIRTLQESIRDLEGSASGRSEPGLLGRFLERPRSLDSSQSHEDVPRLRSELRSAIEAEEKNKKAMDDLAVTLKEVMTEVYQLKEELSTTQSELDTARAEADHAESMWKTAEDRLLLVSGEASRLRLEADESAAAWNAKEDGFVNCMKMSEEEITKLKRENSKLAESHRIAREENSKLRDIMKQALNEATIVKGALEIARSENSQLKDLLSEKDDALKSMRQDYENLKVSEAAAVDSVEELKNLLAAESATDVKSSGARRRPSDHTGSLAKPEATAPKEEKEEEEEGPETMGVAKFRSEQWASDDEHHHPCVPNGRKYPGARPDPFPGSMSERVTLPGHTDYPHKPLSCASDLTAPSLHGFDAGDMSYEEFDHHVGRIHLDVMNNNERSGVPPKHRKKKQILRRFGDLLRRGSVPK
ncbi:hypothetical protein Taro_011782 [Colocasia esculenta]|uniref:Uncharacterized protein n=1 Tax=Colocasia esculenta TaxID=4460 RepID=A0A843UB17_COLES|nr:hypothetical protein [Colocasia esculenta]